MGVRKCWFPCAGTPQNHDVMQSKDIHKTLSSEESKLPIIYMDAVVLSSSKYTLGNTHRYAHGPKTIRDYLWIVILGGGFFKDFIFRVGEGEEHGYVRETSIGCLLHAPQPGTKPTTQECALTRNRTGDLLLCRMTLNQLSPAGQGGGGFEPHHQRGHGFLLLYTFFLKCLLKSCITSVDTQLLKQSTFLKQHLYTQIFFSFPSMSLKLRVNPKAQFMHVCVCVYVHTCVYMYTHIHSCIVGLGLGEEP